ncbi:FadR family transcriptional regulator [Propioniciclava sinopodophylli]|uniref:FadR family transcriptional regulator n=1 Tax=Propioniciclava sinopodophylli TaxID=1837344 RepID=A0A4Q9KBT0_9ACTN|nr:FadR/GntR family transcriptional regulator [Propioniciclava sinopodophylli]TBT83222.1 FadR family transcriptional regulator [Propioniciclava sinopodophylli]
MKPDRYRDGTNVTVQGIKDLILARGLKPGDPMPTEAVLVEELGVSRSSIREAVRTLVALDILEVRHGTGTFVGKLSLRPLVEGMVFRGVLMPGDENAMLREIVEVRTGLDMSLAPQIVERLSHGDADDLRACVEQMKERAARNEPFPEEDRIFHLQLAQRLGNALYGQLVAAFWDIHMTVGPSLGAAPQRELNATALAHERMLDAALAGDLAEYQDAVHAHYEPILRMLTSWAS